MGSGFMLKENIEQIINKAAGTLGYEIYESTIYLHGKNSKITVKIDSLSGITHQDCDKYSRELTSSLDNEAILPDYVLEISSPGLDRKVRSLEEFKRFAGRLVKFTVEEKDKRETLSGTIKSVDGNTVVIKTDKGDKNYDFGKIIKASLDF
jgi:ribosome maturation factor RimP